MISILYVMVFPCLASKADVKNDLYDIVKVHGSYLKP